VTSTGNVRFTRDQDVLSMRIETAHGLARFGRFFGAHWNVGNPYFTARVGSSRTPLGNSTVNIVLADGGGRVDLQIRSHRSLGLEIMVTAAWTRHQIDSEFTLADSVITMPAKT
jgi:hypothetical protein